MMSKIFLSFIPILFTFSPCSQTITEGEFYYNTPVIPVLPPKETFLTGFIFNPNQFVLLSVDGNDKLLSRTVIDLPSNRRYFFNYESSEPYYFTKPISNSSNFFKMQSSYLLMWGYRVQDIDTSNTDIAGFPCSSANVYSRGYDPRVCYFTSSIRFPAFAYPGPGEIKSILDTTVILKATVNTKNGPVTVGVDTVYQSILHPEWLSTDTLGLIHLTEHRNLKDDNKIEQWHNNTSQKGEGLESGYKLYKDGYLSPYRLNILTNSNQAIDPLNLMLFSHEDNKATPPLELFSAFLNNNLIENESFELIKSILEESDDSYSWYDIRQILMITKMKEYFNDSTIRQNIYNNLKALGYELRNDKLDVINSFLSGEGYVDDLFRSLSYFIEPPELYSTSDLRKIEISANELLNSILPSLSGSVNIEIDTSNAQMEVSVISKKDTILYQTPYSYFWSNEDNNELESNQADLFQFDDTFIQRLLPVIEQIKCDNGINNIIHFDHFESILEKIDTEAYFDLINKYPELNLFSGTFFTISIPKYHPAILNYGSIPITMPIPYPEEVIWQTKIHEFTKNAHLGDYFSTSKKKDLLNYISKNMEAFYLTKSSFKEYESQILNKLIPANSAGLEELLSCSYSVYLLGFGSSDNSDLNFSSDAATFESEFNDLYRFFHGDIYGINLQSKNGGTHLTWENEMGETVELTLTHSSVQKCIVEYFAKHPPDPNKRIYTIPGLSYSSKKYFYLSDDQRSTLENILGIRFIHG